MDLCIVIPALAFPAMFQGLQGFFVLFDRPIQANEMVILERRSVLYSIQVPNILSRNLIKPVFKNDALLNSFR